MLLKKTILIFFLFALFGKTECYKYLSMALTVRQDGSHTSYNLPFIINAYEYELSISLTSVANYFHNYQQVAADKNTVAKQYQPRLKSSSDMFAVAKVYQRQSSRLEDWRKPFHQLFLYFESLKSIPIVANMKTIVQIPKDKKPNKLADGVLSFGPLLSQNTMLLDLRRSFDGVDGNHISLYKSNERAQLHFGVQNEYWEDKGTGELTHTINLERGNEEHPFWTVSTQELVFGVNINTTIKDLKRWKKPMNFKMTLDSTNFVLPLEIEVPLLNAFNTASMTCKFKNRNNRQFLSCIGIQQKQYKSIVFSLLLPNNSNSLNIYLSDTLISYDSLTQEATFSVVVGGINELAIGDCLLNRYYVSLNIKESKLTYGPKVIQQSHFIFWYLFCVFVAGNLLMLVLAMFEKLWFKRGESGGEKMTKIYVKGEAKVSKYCRPSQQEIIGD